MRSSISTTACEDFDHFAFSAIADALDLRLQALDPARLTERRSSAITNHRLVPGTHRGRRSTTRPASTGRAASRATDARARERGAHRKPGRLNGFWIPDARADAPPNVPSRRAARGRADCSNNRFVGDVAWNEEGLMAGTPFDVSGRVIWATGSSRAVGREVAEHLAAVSAACATRPP